MMASVSSPNGRQRPLEGEGEDSTYVETNLVPRLGESRSRRETAEFRQACLGPDILTESSDSSLQAR